MAISLVPCWELYVIATYGQHENTEIRQSTTKAEPLIQKRHLQLSHVRRHSSAFRRR